MPTETRQNWIKVAALFCLSVFGSELAAAETDFNGIWLIRHRATIMGDRVDWAEDAKDRKVIQIDHDPATGKVTMRAPDLTPEMLALGYEPHDPTFEGGIQGNAAVGFGGLINWNVLWRTDVNCPPPSGLQFGSGGRIEFIIAVMRSKTCQWSFSNFADYGNVQHIVYTLEPLFVVREMRFIDLPEDGSSGQRITTAELHQKFRIEIEFNAPPPAAIYVDFGGKAARSLVAVRPTSNPSVFTSRVITRAEFVPGARL